MAFGSFLYFFEEDWFRFPIPSRDPRRIFVAIAKMGAKGLCFRSFCAQARGGILEGLGAEASESPQRALGCPRTRKGFRGLYVTKNVRNLVLFSDVFFFENTKIALRVLFAIFR